MLKTLKIVNVVTIITIIYVIGWMLMHPVEAKKALKAGYAIGNQKHNYILKF